MEINKILDDAIRKASEGMSNKIDAHLLTDLKRMSELGVLKIEEEQPEFTPFDEANRTISVSQKIRLSFTGEETIKELRKEIEDLKKGLSIRDMFDEASSRYLMPSQQGKKTAFMDGAKWYREILPTIIKTNKQC